MHSDDPLFFNSYLLFSEQAVETLRAAKVGISGLGGVGAISAELLARAGVGSFRMADPDAYEPRNLNRQLFATGETLGRNKARVGADRVRSINPACDVAVFEEGVVPANAMEFCRGLDVVVCESDTESSKVVLHRAAKELRVPLVGGSRSSLHEHRWKVKARVWDYRSDPDLPGYDEANHPELVSVPTEAFGPALRREFDEKIREKKKGIFREVAERHPEYFGSIDAASLRARLAGAEDFHNRHVCSVIANTGGSLAAAAALRLLLGGPAGEIEVNLWEGGTA